MSEQKRNIKFKYNKPEDYKSVYANGVFGGLTTRGDINCHFFFEYPSIPKTQEFEVTADGKIGEEVKKSEGVPMINRDLKVGVIFKVEDAEAIAKWILEKVKLVKGEKTE